MNTLQPVFDSYKDTRLALETVETNQKAEIAPHLQKVNEIKAAFKEDLEQTAKEERQARKLLETAAREAKRRNLFPKARLQLDGGYIEVQKEKQEIFITDLLSVLKNFGPEILQLLLRTVSLNQEMALSITKNYTSEELQMAGLVIKPLPQVVKISIAKEKHE